MTPRPSAAAAPGPADMLAAGSVPWFESDEDAISFVSHGGAPQTRMGFTEDEERLLSGNYGQPTNAGLFIGPESALRVSTSYACRRVISEDVAKLPIRLVRRSTIGNGRTSTVLQHDHPVHKLLAEEPNDWMTAFEFIEYMVGVATFHEGAYAIVQRDQHGRIDELLPLLPGCCGVEIDQYWRPTYRVSGYGETLLFEPHQIFRLNGPMADPFKGHSTISLAREAVGLAAAIEASQARFHSNDLRPSGILSTSVKLGEGVRERIRDSWKSAYGAGGTGGIAILDEGFDFKPLMAEGAKSEVIENRKFQVSDQCRFFRVFPLVIGHNDGSQTFSSVEAMLTAHAQHSLHPWVRRLEQAATKLLLTDEERAAGLSVDIDMSALSRGTLTERVNAYDKASKIYLTPNEIREAEGYDRLDDPAMDRVQLPANNTGLMPSPQLAGPSASPAPARPSGVQVQS